MKREEAVGCGSQAHHGISRSAFQDTRVCVEASETHVQRHYDLSSRFFHVNEDVTRIAHAKTVVGVARELGDR